MVTQLDGTVVSNFLFDQEIHFFVSDKHDTIQKSHTQGMFYENEELNIISEFFPRGGVFVDVGANVGNHSVYVAKYLHPKMIVLFEPNPPAIAILRTNIALNNLQHLVDLSHIGFGLSDAAGKANANWPSGNLGATRLSASTDGSGNLPLVLGDDALSQRRVDFLKIDVEGMEMKVLAGLKQTIARWRPSIFIEIENVNVQGFLDWTCKQDYLVKQKFRRYEANENYMVIPKENE